MTVTSIMGRFGEAEAAFSVAEATIREWREWFVHIGYHDFPNWLCCSFRRPEGTKGSPIQP